MLKTDPWTYKIQDLNGKKIIGSFYQKELFVQYMYCTKNEVFY